MKKIYISYCTEYEAGWGSKPDGIVLSLDKDKLSDLIKPYNNREKGSYELFWQYTEPEEMMCEDGDVEKILFNDEGVFYSETMSDLPIHLYKKLN